MRVTEVESTDLFTGSAGRALQVVRVTVAATEAAEEGVTTLLRVMGAAASTPQPFGITLGKPGEGRTGEVSVAVTGAPGAELPVTAIAEAATAGGGRAELAGSVTVAEPGWTMWMVSHFHYDPVWWNTQGQFTEAKLVLPDEDGELPDTRSAFDLVRLHLEKARRDQDYKFVLAEVDYLKPHFDAFPHDRAFLRSLLADGRAELVGGTYNEPNTNLTGAETTIRNAVYGMGFQRGVLGTGVRGTEPASAWMLDAFGFDPGFPGLMAAAGLSSSSWARGPFHQWGPAENTRMQFPAEFEWLSPDGSGLLTAYMANHYGAGWTLHTATDLEAALRAAHEQFRELAAVAATRNVMLPVGSDHVIPARWVTDVAREWGARYLWPRFVTAIPREFFAAVRADAEASPARYWIMPQTRDMNPVYTGKDVSYADTKLASRAGEIAVLEGERLATLAWLRGAPYPAESLDKAWRQLAYGAHHDAITGTESDEVYLDLLGGWREAWQRGDEARRDAVAFLTGTSQAPRSGAAGLAVTVVNALARERDGMATATVRLAAPGTPWLAVTDPVTGDQVPALAEGVRRHQDGSLAEVTLTFRARTVPALGFLSYPLAATPGPAGPGDDGWADADGLAIENDAFRVAGADGHGALSSVVDKAAGREVLTRPGNDLVLQEEYQQHPRWNEGPWHLSPKGPGVAASSGEATVRAQRSPAGSRLVASYSLGGLSVTAETLLWDGADRVEFRTHVSGSIGKDHLLRVRFPAALPGGLPVYQTATAVIGRPFGTPEADVAKHWWTLENPANHWFGVGSVARMSLPSGTGDASTGDAGAGDVAVALGVAEVITPDLTPSESRPAVKDLVTWLARAGVTATCSRSSGTRYGSVDLDSNLPDFRIALGGPSVNAFTAEVLSACDPSVAKRLAQLVAESGAARLWVPASRSRAAAFMPDADLRGPRDLPVLIVATAEPAALDGAVGDLARDVMSQRIPAEVCEGNALAAGDAPLAAGAVAVFNKGTLGAAVTPDGTLWMSLFRACSGWPSGVWIDGDRRTAPDGSSFAWQHWSHTFSYALASAGGHADWRSAGFNAAAEDYNHDLIAVVTEAADAGSTPSPGGAGVGGAALGGAGAGGAGAGGAALGGAPSVTLSALKPVGNPLAAGLPGTPPRAPREVTVRLRETDGLTAVARLRLAAGIEAAWRSDLLEESYGVDAPLAEGTGQAGAIEVIEGTARVPLRPFETATLRVRLAEGGAAEGGAARGAAEPGTVAAGPPEPAQPVFTRYWLHGKGPAPAGNVPVAVHFSPTRVTLAGAPGDHGAADAGAADAAREPGESGGDAAQVTLTVAAGPAGGRGHVEFVVPDGLSARAAGVGHAGAPLGYDLEPNGFAAWDVRVSALPGTPGGRYFLTARITDGLGQVLEDAVLVTIGEPGPPDPNLEPEELFFRLQADVMALTGEAHLELATTAVRLAPGESGELVVRVASHLASQLRGEVQLVSPVGTWEGTGPWTQPVTVAPGGDATVRFAVTVPATATPGWESWLLVKLMYFGRVHYSDSVPLTVL